MSKTWNFTPVEVTIKNSLCEWSGGLNDKTGGDPKDSETDFANRVGVHFAIRFLDSERHAIIVHRPYARTHKAHTQ